MNLNSAGIQLPCAMHNIENEHCSYHQSTRANVVHCHRPALYCRLENFRC